MKILFLLSYLFQVDWDIRPRNVLSNTPVQLLMCGTGHFRTSLGVKKRKIWQRHNAAEQSSFDVYISNRAPGVTWVRRAMSN